MAITLVSGIPPSGISEEKFLGGLKFLYLITLIFALVNIMHTKQIVENILALFIINQEITVYKLTMEEVHCTDYLLQK